MDRPNGDREEMAARDRAAGFEILNNFRRFNQRYDVFNRSSWDPFIHSEKTVRFYETYAKPLETWRHVDGYTQKDYALRNASWQVTDLFAEFKEGEDRREGFLDEFSVLREPAAERHPVDSPKAMSAEIKRVAKVFGADLVGITAMTSAGCIRTNTAGSIRMKNPTSLPDGLKHVIVIAQEMDYDLITTVPSALSGTATGLGYSKDTVVLLSLAQYIRNLGYQAVASLNDTALAIPLAIQAGLGEYGRHGLLITKEFGPRVRLGKIFTDIPLANDQPIRFGVREFCDVAGAAPAPARPRPSLTLWPQTKSSMSPTSRACASGP